MFFGQVTFIILTRKEFLSLLESAGMLLLGASWGISFRVTRNLWQCAIRDHQTLEHEVLHKGPAWKKIYAAVLYFRSEFYDIL